MTTTGLIIVDTHAHLDMDAFAKDRPEAIARALKAGVAMMITVGTSLESSKKAIELAEKYPEILATVGIHPHDVAGVDKTYIARLAEIASHPRVVAIGEVGLDFYRNYSPHEAQLQALKWQLDLAAKLQLPVIIHCRQAEKDMLKLLHDWVSSRKSPQEESPGVIHCFSGNSDTAHQYLDMGFYLSLGAYIGYTASQSWHHVIREIPADRLLVETDCPFLPPPSYRGQRNEPSYIPLTVETLARIRDESPEMVARETTQNAQRLFRFGENNKKDLSKGIAK
ncbi:MAG: TatD family hydrolase [Chloroflexi bacterium]|nr:TatD family hydrolase [Chloroflexota bacterium]